MLFIYQLILTTDLGIIISILWKKNKLREIIYLTHNHITRKPRIKGLKPRFFLLQSLCYNHIKNFFIYWWEKERKRERRETLILICFSTYLCIHWLILVCALTGDRTHNLGISEWCSNQLSYLSKACVITRFDSKLNNSWTIKITIRKVCYLPM